MQIPLILAETTATVAEAHSVGAALPHLLGMLLVVMTLTVLWGVCVLSATLIKTFVPAPAAPAPAKAAPKPTAPEGPSPELVAVISAAVAAVTDSAHRIVAIKPQSSSWAKAGRQSVLSSHKIR